MYSDNPMVEKSVGLDALSSNHETTVQRLERQKDHLQERIDDINEALTLLQKYPDMEKLTDLLRRI